MLYTYMTFQKKICGLFLKKNFFTGMIFIFER